MATKSKKSSSADGAGSPKKRARRAKRGDRMSGLDAAAKVLAEAGQPLRCGQIVEAMMAKGYWATKGKTPASTIYSAIIREIAGKGSAARFVKAERGKFAAASRT
jgi:hypothetical protein